MLANIAAASRPAQSTPAATLGLAQIMAMVRRWWWTCASVGVVIAVIACAVVWQTFTPIYEATALLEVKSHQPRLLFDVTGGSPTFAETQLEIIRSTVVLVPVSKRTDVARCSEVQEAEAPLDWLNKGLRVGYRGRSELCQITFRSREPDTAAQIANAVMDEYLALYSGRSSQETLKVIDLLKSAKEDNTKLVEAYKQKVHDLAELRAVQDGVVVASGQDTAFPIQSKLNNYEQELGKVQVGLVILQAKLDAAKQQAEAKEFVITDEQLDAALEAEPQIQRLRSELALAKDRLQQNQRFAKSPNNVTSQTVSREIAELTKEIEVALADAKPRIAKALEAEARAELENKVAAFETEIHGQKVAEEHWTEVVKAEREKVKVSGGDSVELEIAKGELGRAQEIQDKLSSQILALQTERGAPARAERLQEALVPLQPLEAIPLKRLGVAIMVSMCIPFGCAFLWERHLKRISDSGQLASELSLQVLGEITALPARAMLPGGRSSDRFLRDRVLFEESIESLRVALMLTPELRDLQVLTVTSAISQEGKTSLASSLAASIARCTRQPTLIIDADLRAPDLHELFGIALTYGLADVLCGQCQLEEAIVHDAEQGIDILPAGELHANPHRLLDNGRLASLIETLRGKYRHIIVDGPPVLGASEAVVIASASDGVVVCAMRDYSRSEQLQLATRRLSAAGVNILGAVFSGVPIRSWASRYGSDSYGHDRYLHAAREWAGTSARESDIDDALASDSTPS
jgi:capsular exopolysaccharide synthesis family protein